MKKRHRAGQALVEMAVVVTLLMFLVMSIAEFGWAFMESSLIMHAARDGARFAATMPATQRTGPGCISTTNATVVTHVTTALQGTGFTPTVTLSQNTCAANGIPTVTVRIVGTMQTLFNFLGSGFDVDRTITFEDEGRTCPSAC